MFRARGFTLVELLVALGLAALMIGLAPIAYERMREGAQYRDTVRAMLGDLRSARQLAGSQGRSVPFSVDLAQRRFGVDGNLNYTLPPSIEVRAEIADIELSTDAVASIRFLPEGGATGGRFDIVRPSGDGARLRVDWLFGHITQEVLTP